MESSGSIAERIKDAIIKRIEGVRDIKRRLDYLMKPEFLETSARLTETQWQGIAECEWLSDNFPSLEPLGKFARKVATWSISDKGKGRDDAISMIMASEHKELLGALGITLPAPEKTEKGKGKKND